MREGQLTGVKFVSSRGIHTLKFTLVAMSEYATLQKQNSCFNPARDISHRKKSCI